MGRKMDALLGRNLKTSKFKANVNLAISRLAVLKNQRRARLSVARADVLQLLNINHQDRALLRVDQVIKEQNGLDVLEMIEGYCLLLMERLNLIEQEKVCPDELKEAVASLMYSATRVGQFPELQEIRSALTNRFGKEFAARAVELRSDCGVNHKMIQKLSTKQSELETRMNLLKMIASENGIVLQLGLDSSFAKEAKLEVDKKQDEPKLETAVIPVGAKIGRELPSGLLEEIEGMLSFSESMKEKRRYRDAADAAQAAFESAAYAAAAARAAVELSRSDSFGRGSRNSQTQTSVHAQMPKNSELRSGEERESKDSENEVAGSGYNEFRPAQSYHSGSEDSDAEKEETQTEGSTRSSVRNKQPAREIFFDRSDDEATDDRGDTSRTGNAESRHNATHGSIKEVDHAHERHYPLMPERDTKSELQREDIRSRYAAEEPSRDQVRKNQNSGGKPTSVRTRRLF